MADNNLCCAATGDWRALLHDIFELRSQWQYHARRDQCRWLAPTLRIRVRPIQHFHFRVRKLHLRFRLDLRIGIGQITDGQRITSRRLPYRSHHRVSILHATIFFCSSDIFIKISPYIFLCGHQKIRATSFLGPHKFVVTVRESRKATYTVEVFGEVQKQDNNTYSPVI